MNTILSQTRFKRPKRNRRSNGGLPVTPIVPEPIVTTTPAPATTTPVPTTTTTTTT